MTKLRSFVAEPLEREVAFALERLERETNVAAIAVMPDVHLASDVCVGCVIATHTQIFPAAVGGDIGCGMAAMRFFARGDVLHRGRNGERLLDALSLAVPTLRRRGPCVLPEALTRETSVHEKLAAVQLGTLGRGNHFVELQEDTEGSLWAMVHTGSRGVGDAVRSKHDARWLEGEAAERYLTDMTWALRFADANRRAIFAALTEVLRDVLRVEPDTCTYFSCHHNWVQKEGDMFVHRKGAISAREGEWGIVPGSMGTKSYHVTGRGNAAALYSSAHGAGRRMSRGDARKRISGHAFERQMERVIYDRKKADQLRDEAPGAYKDIRAVMRAQSDLVRIERELTPLLAFKGV